MQLKDWNKFTDICLMDEFPNPSAKEQATIWVVLCAKDGKIRHIIVLSYEPNFSLFSSQHYSKSCWLLSWGVGKFVRRTTVNRPEDHYGQVLYIYIFLLVRSIEKEVINLNLSKNQLMRFRLISSSVWYNNVVSRLLTSLLIISFFLKAIRSKITQFCVWSMQSHPGA